MITYPLVKEGDEIPRPSKLSVSHKFIYILIFAIFLYSFVRAYLLSITHDEALTYLIHASGSFGEIFAHSLPIGANNHLLNTLLVKIFTNILGGSEFVIRLPAFLGLGLYLWGTFKLLKLFLKEHFLLIGFSLLIINPFMLDFFSLARGYSFALGFLSVGLYYAFKTIEETDHKEKIKKMAIASTILSFSVLSQLTFVIIYFSIITIFFAVGLKDLSVAIKQRETGSPIFKRFLHGTLLPIIPGGLLLLIIYVYPLINMIGEGELLGGKKGFWADTVTSLISATLYNKTYLNLNIIFALKALIILSIVSSISILIYKSIKKIKFKPADRYLSFITASILISSITLILMNILFNIDYPLERSGLYFIPLWTILLLILWQRSRDIHKQSAARGLSAVFYLLTVVFTIHFFNTANFTHTYSWKYDASTKAMMTYVDELNKEKLLKEPPVMIGFFYFFVPSMNYYRLKNELTFLAPGDRSGPVGKYDLYYLNDDPVGETLIERYNLKILKSFEVSETFLAAPQKTR